MSDWQDADAYAQKLERDHAARFLIVVRLLVFLVLVMALLFLAFRAAVAAPEQQGSVAYFQAMPEADFAAVIITCRDNQRYAETPSCVNAELAFERRYAEVLRRSRLAMLRSPLFWADNPIMAKSVREACARKGRNDGWALPYCGVVPPGKMT